MYFAEIQFTNPRNGLSVTARALFDSGFSGGIWLPRRYAREIEATLVKTDRPPLTIEGRAIRGKATGLHVRLVEAGVERDETPVFSPSSGPADDLMIGAYFMAQVGARIVVGNASYAPQGGDRLTQNRRRAASFDFSDWVLPTHRAVTPWW